VAVRAVRRAGLDEDVLTRIYGEEDWSATLAKDAAADDEGTDDDAAAARPSHGADGRPLDRNRMAGLT